MAFLLVNPPPSTPISLSFKLSSSFKPKRISLSASSYPIRRTKTIPATDTIIDFGKHKGRMLGTLPSSYLRWVSKNLRAGDTEKWANLADEVLEDPIYKDRIEWEFAENVLNGNSAKGKEDESSVSVLLEISERFGWDNEDKEGWSKVKFELLGTSNGGRLPRLGGVNSNRPRIREDNSNKQVKRGDGVIGEKRRERRERMKLKKERENFGGGDDGGGGGGFRSGRDETVEILNPFPGREALLKKKVLKLKEEAIRGLMKLIKSLSLFFGSTLARIIPMSRGKKQYGSFYTFLPRHSLIAWLITLDRLPTKDRLCKWKQIDDPLCKLCSVELESRNHLFFNCRYTHDTWKEILELYTVHRLVLDWYSELACACSRLKGKSLIVLILKIARCVLFYFI